MYQSIAFRTAYLLTGSAADAEDAAQTGFVKAWRALPRFRAGSPFRPWLLRIVANEAHNRRRSAGRAHALQLRAAAAEPSGDAAPSPEGAALGREQREALVAAVQRLGRARSRRPDLPLSARALRGGDRNRPRCPPRHCEVTHRARARPSPDRGGAVTDLERALGSSRRELDVPETPGSGAGRARPARAARAAARGARAAGSSPSRSSSSPRWRRRWRFPDARAALFRLLSIGGERIELVDELPEMPVQDDLELALGERVTLDEAGESASAFPLRELDEPPDRVYVGADRARSGSSTERRSEPRLLVAQSSLRPTA